MFASVKRVTDVAKPNPNQQLTAQATPPQPAQPTSASNQQKLELAKRLAARINKSLGPDAQDITQQAAAAFLKGEMATPQVAVSFYSPLVLFRSFHTHNIHFVLRVEQLQTFQNQH